MVAHTAASALAAHRPPSAKDIPPVALVNIPHVEPAAFNSYLANVGTLYDAFQRAKTDALAADVPLKHAQDNARAESQ